MDPSITTTSAMTRQPKRTRPSLDKKQVADPPRNEIRTPVIGELDQTDDPADTQVSAVSGFRNVSACDRCRKRKNRCDQKLPSCSGCEKAGIQCVGYDPVLKRVIPRSYFFYLENRVAHLEALLQSHDIAYPDASDLTLPSAPTLKREYPSLVTSGIGFGQEQTRVLDNTNETRRPLHGSDVQDDHVEYGQEDVRPESSPHDFTGSDHRAATSAISFARIMYAAVEKSMPSSARRPSQTNVTTKGSFFGLYTPPTVQSAPFPDRETADRLVNLYFEYSNPQIPTLHRPEYEALVDRVYAKEQKNRSSRELYFLNIVFAIGAGIFVDNDSSPRSSEPDGSPNRKRQRTSRPHHQPEEYHAAAMENLKVFATSPHAIRSIDEGLEELQAVLLLAGYALLRPSTPGLWYISGVASRQAIDLGLYMEDSIPRGNQHEVGVPRQREQHGLSHDAGRRQWSQDMRRRLWLSVYSFDRLVAVCVGRPVSISDTVITTKFPSLLDDDYITPQGIESPQASNISTLPSYKYIAQHYFHLRQLQSEILDVLQNRQAQIAVALRKKSGRSEIPRYLSSPYLARHRTFREWRIDVDRRLWEWFKSSPTKEQAGVAFEPVFFELNYRQTVVMLYRHSLAVPLRLANELDTATGEDSKDPRHVDLETEDDQQMVFLKVAEAGYKTLRIYRQLNNLRLVNYTYLGTHHLFMCGISLLSAIWHSPLVRSKLSHEEIDLTFLAATTVLTSLIPKCPPAEACRDALKRMAAITITMCLRHTGFGADAERYLMNQMQPDQVNQHSHRPQTQQHANVTYSSGAPISVRPTPDFDEGFKSLFSDTEIAQLSAPSHLPPTFRLPPRRTGGSASISTSSNIHPTLPSQWQQAHLNNSPAIDPALRTTNTMTSLLDITSQKQTQTQTRAQAQPLVAAETVPHPDDYDDINALLAYDGDFTLDPSLAHAAHMGSAFALRDGADADAEAYPDADAGVGVGLGLGAGTGAGWSENDVAVMMGGYFFGEGNGGQAL